MKSGEFRKTIYFNVNQFSEKELENCISDLDIKLDSERSVWGIGIDFIGNQIKHKIYYEKLKVSKNEIVEFVNKFNIMVLFYDNFYKINIFYN